MKTKIYSGRTIVLQKGDLKLDIKFREEERNLALASTSIQMFQLATRLTTTLVKGIADEFNKRLAQASTNSTLARRFEKITSMKKASYHSAFGALTKSETSD